LHFFRPAGAATAARPAIVFFGGGWQRGTPLQFYPECRARAAKGMVAISADYCTAFSHGTSAFEAVADGKSAIRWVRAHSRELGIDPHRIPTAGASAGGQLAAAGIITGLDDATEDGAVSSRPDALALRYPVIDNGPLGYGDAAVKGRYQEISPPHNVSAQSPPTLFFLGTKDPLVPVATAREFESRMKNAGVRCEVKLIEGGGHPVYAYQDGLSALRDDMLNDCVIFLRAGGLLPSD
jgi:acetyl esterase/lipase